NQRGAIGAGRRSAKRRETPKRIGWLSPEQDKVRQYALRQLRERFTEDNQLMTLINQTPLTYWQGLKTPIQIHAGDIRMDIRLLGHPYVALMAILHGMELIRIYQSRGPPQESQEKLYQQLWAYWRPLDAIFMQIAPQDRVDILAFLKKNPEIY